MRSTNDSEGNPNGGRNIALLMNHENDHLDARKRSTGGYCKLPVGSARAGVSAGKDVGRRGSKSA